MKSLEYCLVSACRRIDYTLSIVEIQHCQGARAATSNPPLWIPLHRDHVCVAPWEQRRHRASTPHTSCAGGPRTRGRCRCRWRLEALQLQPMSTVTTVKGSRCHRKAALASWACLMAAIARERRRRVALHASLCWRTSGDIAGVEMPGGGGQERVPRLPTRQYPSSTLARWR